MHVLYTINLDTYREDNKLKSSKLHSLDSLSKAKKEEKILLSILDISKGAKKILKSLNTLRKIS